MQSLHERVAGQPQLTCPAKSACELLATTLPPGVMTSLSCIEAPTFSVLMDNMQSLLPFSVYVSYLSSSRVPLGMTRDELCIDLPEVVDLRSPCKANRSPFCILQVTYYIVLRSV